jgi:uncharacterized protein YwlG (UPF0340 family)
MDREIVREDVGRVLVEAFDTVDECGGIDYAIDICGQLHHAVVVSEVRFVELVLIGGDDTGMFVVVVPRVVVDADDIVTVVDEVSDHPLHQ